MSDAIRTPQDEMDLLAEALRRIRDLELRVLAVESPGGKFGSTADLEIWTEGTGAKAGAGGSTAQVTADAEGDGVVEEGGGYTENYEEGY